MEEQRKKERTVQEKGEPASLSRVTVAQWWHSENERGLSVDGRSLTGNKATGCLYALQTYFICKSGDIIIDNGFNVLYKLASYTYLATRFYYSVLLCHAELDLLD